MRHRNFANILDLVKFRFSYYLLLAVGLNGSEGELVMRLSMNFFKIFKSNRELC